jgi:hypothetical protein
VPERIVNSFPLTTTQTTSAHPHLVPERITHSLTRSVESDDRQPRHCYSHFAVEPPASSRSTKITSLFTRNTPSRVAHVRDLRSRDCLTARDSSTFNMPQAKSTSASTRPTTSIRRQAQAASQQPPPHTPRAKNEHTDIAKSSSMTRSGTHSRRSGYARRPRPVDGATARVETQGTRLPQRPSRGQARRKSVKTDMTGRSARGSLGAPALRTSQGACSSRVKVSAGDLV